MTRDLTFYRRRDIAVMVVLAGLGFYLFKALFVIGMPSPKFSGCLTHKIFLVSKLEEDVVRGGIYAVSMDRDLKIAKKGEKLMKIVAATGGDKVRVDLDGVWVNEKTYYPVPLHGIAGRLKIPESEVMKTITVPAGHLYLIGNTDRSYDSGFWGTIDEKNVIGRAITVM